MTDTLTRDERRVIESYRRVRNMSSRSPVMVTFVIVNGITQVWEGAPHGVRRSKVDKSVRRRVE